MQREGTTHVENEERVFRGHDLRRAVVRYLERFLVPPFVAARGERNLVTGTPEDEDMLNKWALFESCVDDGLGRDGLTSPTTLVGGDKNAGFAVLGTITEGLGGKSSEDNRVNSTDAGTSKESGDGVPSHGEVNRYGVALLDSHRLQDIGDAAHFT